MLRETKQDELHEANGDFLYVVEWDDQTCIANITHYTPEIIKMNGRVDRGESVNYEPVVVIDDAMFKKKVA